MDSHQGYTALHIAASHGHLDTTLVLLKFGAGLTFECEGSYQRPGTHLLPVMGRARTAALHLATARRNILMCRAMLQAHASVTRPPLDTSAKWTLQQYILICTQG